MHATGRATDQRLCRSRSVEQNDDVTATNHLRHCEILQVKVSSVGSVNNIIVICRKKILLMLCARIIEICSILLNLLKTKLVTFF